MPDDKQDFTDAEVQEICDGCSMCLDCFRKSVRALRQMGWKPPHEIERAVGNARSSGILEGMLDDIEH